MLKVENLSFQYANRSVLTGVSFETQPDTINVLLGPNGSGKTTLLRCLDLFLKPSSGTMLLNGTPITELSPNALARRIAYMPQRCGITGLTVFDAVLLGRKPYLSRNPTADDYELVEKTLQRLDLHDKAIRRLDQLSGGELQKVTLARVFVQEPELVLLDEPTSSLDLKNRVEILRHLTHFVRHCHATVVMSVHDLNDALRVADRLLFLKQGVLVANETPDTITEEVLSDVYGIPLEIYSRSRYRFVTPQGD